MKLFRNKKVQIKWKTDANLKICPSRYSWENSVEATQTAVRISRQNYDFLSKWCFQVVNRSYNIG